MLSTSGCRQASVCSCSVRQALSRPSLGRSTALRLRTGGRQGARPARLAAKSDRGGAGVLENPTTAPTIEKGTETNRRKPPIYKVLLHNDNYNRREYVVKILLKIVEGMTVDDAVNVMQEAHESGIALVVACAQDKAENYVEGLRLNGLISTMEPGA